MKTRRKMGKSNMFYRGIPLICDESEYEQKV